MTVVENGQPVVGAQVFTVINGIKGPAGGTETESATNSAGQVSFPTDLLNIIKGTRVDVYKRVCRDGRVEILVTPEGQGDACTAGEAQPGEQCSCEKIGSFIWGMGNVIIDIGTNTVTGPEETGMPGGWEVNVGGGGIYSYNDQLQDTACGSPARPGCEVDDKGFGGNVFFEVKPWRNFGIGVDVAYNSFETTETSEHSSGLSMETKVDTEAVAATPYLFGYWNLAQTVSIFSTLGMGYLWNTGTVNSRIPSLGETIEEDRSENGVRLAVALGMELMIARRIGWRLAYGFRNGASNDADRQHQLRMALFVTLISGLAR
jgi:hypothetical protein